MEDPKEVQSIIFTLYKIAMPIISVIFTVILGYIATWIKNMSVDVGEIKQSITRHEMKTEEHSREIKELKLQQQRTADHVRDIEIKIANK